MNTCFIDSVSCTGGHDPAGRPNKHHGHDSRPHKHEESHASGRKAQKERDRKRREEQDDDEEEEDEDDEDDEVTAGGGTEFKLSKYEAQMQSAVQRLKTTLGGIRTGRAQPGVLEPVMVALSAKEKAPLKRVATVTARSPQLLVVNVYDSSHTAAVAKAIESSPLKMQVRVYVCVRMCVGGGGV